MLIKTVVVSFVIAISAWLMYALIPAIIYKYRRDNSLFQFGIYGKKLLLTFDDGPDPEYTPQVLSILERYGIKAVFFLPTFKWEKYPELVEAIKATGHTIGMHSAAHRNPLLMDPISTNNDIKQCLKAFADKDEAAKFYRPPHGCVNMTILRKIKKENITLLLWNICARDWLNRGEAAVFDSLRRQLTPGAIILLHDSGKDTGGEEGAPECTVAALNRFIPMALSMGYSFIDPDKLVNSNERTD